MGFDVQNILIGILLIGVSFYPAKKIHKKNPEMSERKIAQIFMLIRIVGVVFLISGVT